MLRSAIDNITNSSLSDNQWLQASSPIREGGLGVRRVAALALPAFIASAASTLELQNTILLGSTNHPDRVKIGDLSCQMVIFLWPDRD